MSDTANSGARDLNDMGATPVGIVRFLAQAAGFSDVGALDGNGPGGGFRMINQTLDWPKARFHWTICIFVYTLVRGLGGRRGWFKGKYLE
jgi:hypothetical protein